MESSLIHHISNAFVLTAKDTISIAELFAHGSVAKGLGSTESCSEALLITTGCL